MTVVITETGPDGDSTWEIPDGHVTYYSETSRGTVQLTVKPRVEGPESDHRIERSTLANAVDDWNARDCDLAPDRRHARGTGRSRGECRYCDEPMDTRR